MNIVNASGHQKSSEKNFNLLKTFDDHKYNTQRVLLHSTRPPLTDRSGKSTREYVKQRIIASAADNYSKEELRSSNRTTSSESEDDYAMPLNLNFNPLGSTTKPPDEKPNTIDACDYRDHKSSSSSLGGDREIISALDSGGGECKIIGPRLADNTPKSKTSVTIKTKSKASNGKGTKVSFNTALVNG